MPEVTPINLTLFTHQRDQTQIGLSLRARSVQGDEVAKVVGTAGITPLAGHGVQAAGTQCGEFLQGLMDEGQVGVDAAGAHNTDAWQPGLAQHALNRAVVNLELARNGANPFDVDERVVVTVGKTPYVRFDLNDYSLPHTQVRKSLTMLASTTQVRVLDGQTVVASHARSYDKGQQIEMEVHVKDLVERKAQARTQRGMNRLTQAAPNSRELLSQAGARGENLGAITATLLRLVDRYGAAEVQMAIATALSRGVPHPNAVRLALETQREARQVPPPLEVQFSATARKRDGVIRAHRLDSYDQLTPLKTPAKPAPGEDDDESKSQPE